MLLDNLHGIVLLPILLKSSKKLSHQRFLLRTEINRGQEMVCTTLQKRLLHVVR
jgi:hypothetical protein